MTQGSSLPLHRQCKWLMSGRMHCMMEGFVLACILPQLALAKAFADKHDTSVWHKLMRHIFSYPLSVDCPFCTCLHHLRKMRSSGGLRQAQASGLSAPQQYAGPLPCRGHQQYVSSSAPASMQPTRQSVVNRQSCRRRFPGGCSHLWSYTTSFAHEHQAYCNVKF